MRNSTSTQNMPTHIPVFPGIRPREVSLSIGAARVVMEEVLICWLAGVS